MRELTVLYDPGCGLCRRCRDWLAREPQIVRLRLLPRTAPEVARRFPGLRLDDDLVVVSDTGEVWRGDKAFLVCLHALEGYRSWAARLARPLLRPLVRRTVELLSENRHRVSALLGLRSDDELAAAIRLRTSLEPLAPCGPAGCRPPR